MHRLIRRLAVPAIAAAAVLGGTSTALAATTPATATSATVQPAAYKWILWDGTKYGTEALCNSEGDHIIFWVNTGYSFKCVAMNGGDITYYLLYVGIPT
jgi:hypothetical protein